jgi:phage shock protein PspC (stress-responsive transcriptional regulator)
MVKRRGGAHATHMAYMASAPTTKTPFLADRPQPLRRPIHGRMVAGVAAAVADYVGSDPSVVRIAFVILALLGGLALPMYAAAWLLIPEEGTDLSIAEDFLGYR